MPAPAANPLRSGGIPAADGQGASPARAREGWRVVTVRITRAEDGTISAFEVTGHAGHAPKGRDVVCAAVSVLAQTAALGLEGRLGIAAVVAADAGRFSCLLPPDLPIQACSRAQDILETMCMGLAAIEREYPRHVLVMGDTPRVPAPEGSA